MCLYFRADSTLTGKDIFVSVFALIFRPLALLSALLHLCLQLLESLSETDTVWSYRLLSLCVVYDVTYTCYNTIHKIIRT